MEELKKDYYIKIVGKQEVDGESDVIEVETTASYECKDGIKYISYTEYIEDEEGQSEKDTLVKIESDTLISIIRTGEFQSQLMLELDRQHQCYYSTPFGEMLIKVYAGAMEVELDEDGGFVRVQYSLNFNSDFGSENEFMIELHKLPYKTE